MSDSEDDNIFSSNTLTFQYGNGTISAQGPGINKSHLTGLSFRSNMLTSTINEHAQQYRFNRPQYDQQSLKSRRETSPMSMRSDFGPLGRNMHNSYYPKAMSCQRSLINGRSGSPVSVRSQDTLTSVSAADIANAFKNMTFNNHELRMIKEAYNKLIRGRVRKRIEKRRNLKLFRRGIRRKSGYDSGEQGSASSESSDDCGSVKTTMPFKSATSRRPPNKIDNSLLQKSLKEMDIYTDCTNIIKQNTFRKVFTVASKPVNTYKQNCLDDSREVQEKSENLNGTTLKHRFTKGFSLPSQRFNNTKSKTSVSSEKPNGKVLTKGVNKPNHVDSHIINNESENEQIFPNMSIRSNGNFNSDKGRKRLLDEDNSIICKKRCKINSHPEQNEKSNENNHSDFDDELVFKRPTLPIRKLNGTRNEDVTEVLLKSSQPFTQNTNHNSDSELSQEHDSENNNQTAICHIESNVSMKPSFIKRKLFTQKLDVLGSKNISSDNLAAPSPQAKPNACKEKNKTRKLVSSQSCMSRDVLDDENNVLDLIHKIIPPDQMNSTAASNKRPNKSNNKTDDKIDVASVVSMCNSGDGSGTYTDEEIFNVDRTIERKEDTKKKGVNEPRQLRKDCKINLPNIGDQVNRTKGKTSINIHTLNKGTKVANAVKSFWDTDLESDIEGHSAPAWRQKASVNQVPEISKDVTNSTILKPERKNVSKGSMLTVRGLQNKINNVTILNGTKKTPLNNSPKTDVPNEVDPVKTKTETNKKSKKQTKKESNIPIESIKVNEKIVSSKTKKKPSDSSLKTEVPKKLNLVKSKMDTNKKSQNQSKEETNKSNETDLNISTRPNRNCKKRADYCCGNTVSKSNDIKSNINTQSAKTSKTAKTVKPEEHKKSSPKDLKGISRKAVGKRTKNIFDSFFNNTFESESSINTSRRSLRLMKRLENSKENIQPRLTRGRSKNSSLFL